MAFNNDIGPDVSAPLNPSQGGSYGGDDPAPTAGGGGSDPDPSGSGAGYSGPVGGIWPVTGAFPVVPFTPSQPAPIAPAPVDLTPWGSNSGSGGPYGQVGTYYDPIANGTQTTGNGGSGGSGAPAPNAPPAETDEPPDNPISRIADVMANMLAQPISIPSAGSPTVVPTQEIATKSNSIGAFVIIIAIAGFGYVYWKKNHAHQ